MRIKKIKHIYGDKRIKKFFALFPITIYNFDSKETRWFEYVTIEQVYVGAPVFKEKWINLRFIDK